MENNKKNQGPNTRKTSLNNQPDQTYGREGGDDALSDTPANDPTADEKVIVNEQREHKTVNAPSQTAVNSSETTANDEEVL